MAPHDWIIFETPVDFSPVVVGDNVAYTYDLGENYSHYILSSDNRLYEDKTYHDSNPKNKREWWRLTKKVEFYIEGFCNGKGGYAFFSMNFVAGYKVGDIQFVRFENY